MSYRQDLREAELAVIRAVAPVIDALRHDDGVHTFIPTYEDVVALESAYIDLTLLRSQLDSAPAPYSDDDTSRTAAEMIAPEAGSLRRSVLVELYRRRNNPIQGATCNQMERILKREHETVSPIFTHLRDTGWIVDSGQKTITSSGRPAKVWVLAPGTIPVLLKAIVLDGVDGR